MRIIIIVYRNSYKMAEKTLIPRSLCNSINETVKESRIISTY